MASVLLGGEGSSKVMQSQVVSANLIFTTGAMRMANGTMRSRFSYLWVGSIAALVFGGCNAFDAPGQRGPRLVIPEDQRQAIQSDIAPLPVSGGTLLTTSDGRLAIASDPERDTVSIVDLSNMTLLHTVALEAGDQPGRAVEDSSRHVHIALRRGGAVVSIDVETGAILQRRQVCKAPRGIAFDATSGLLHVACAEGKVVSLSADAGDVTRALSLPPDLRDVTVHGTELWVTRFKSATILRIDAQGSLLQTVELQTRHGTLVRPAGDDLNAPVEPVDVTLQPEVAWRTVAASAGGAIVVHQGAVEEEVKLTKPSINGGSSYGGSGFDCSGIVQNAVSIIDANGAVVSSRGFVGAPLPVDVAASPDGGSIAIAHAGLADPEAPRPFVQFPEGDMGGSVSQAGMAFGSAGITILPASGAGDEPCTFPQNTIMTNAPVVAVAFTPDGRLIAQTREPAQVIVTDSMGASLMTIPLGSDSRFDTGHEIFHRDAGGTLACASCHPEGGEDGHVWQFAGVGKRRTQALHVGLGATKPFHWNGDLDDIGDLMTQVFVGRMGGVRESSDRLDVLTDWLFGLERPPAIRDANDEAAVRGKALFDSPDVGCSGCHSGSHFTNNQNAAVGTTASDAPLQVPSLLAVGYRAPFLHNGCAATLADRFDSACGGAEHGHTSQLGASEISDLIAYLESL